MKFFLKLWKESILKRLIISFVVILLPIYILNIVIYDWGIKTLRREISSSMISQVSFYLDGLEKEIERIQILQYNFLNDQDLNKLATIPQALNNIERMQSILRLQQQLNAIKNSSIYIDDIYALIPAVNRKISPTAVSEFDVHEYSQLRYISLSSRAKFVNVDDKLFLSAGFPFQSQSPNYKKPPIFIVAIELSEQKIRNALESMINNHQERVVLVNLDQKYIISTESDFFSDQQYEQLISVDRDKQEDAEDVVLDGARYIAVYTTSNFLNSILYKYVPENAVFQPLRKYRFWFIGFTIMALVIIVVYSLYIYKFIHKPINKLVDAFKQVENGNFGISIKHNYDDEFRYIYNRFNVMADNLKTSIDQVYKQKIFMQKMELKQLQAQINPHFLYNSFFILNTMARVGDYDTLERFTEQLGEYFRFVTRSAADEVPLSAEVNHARVYTEIQAMRFSNRIKVYFDDMPEEYSKIQVPRLILQPIIENAFVHGLEKKSANGLLFIKFISHENGLDIVVEDNGDTMDDEQLQNLQNKLSNSGDNMEITGMLNIHQRIRLKFGEQSGLKIARSHLGGLKVTIELRF